MPKSRRLFASVVIVSFLSLNFSVRKTSAFLFGLGGGFGLGGSGGCSGCCPSSSCTTTTVTTTTMCCQSCCGCCSNCAQQTFIRTTTTGCGCGAAPCGGGCGASPCGGGCGGAAPLNPIVPIIGPPPAPGGCSEVGSASQFVPYAQPPPSAPALGFLPYSQTPHASLLPALPPLSPTSQLRPVPYVLPQSQSHLSSLGVLSPAHIVQPAPGAHGLSGIEHFETLTAERFENTGKSGKKSKSKSKTTTTTPKSEESEETDDQPPITEKSTDGGDEDMAANSDSTPTKKPSRRTTATASATTAAPKKSKGTAFDDLYDDDSVVPAATRNTFFDAGDISFENRKDSSKTLADVFEKRSKFFENKKSHRQFSAPSIADGRLPTENSANTKTESLCNSYKLARIMVKAMVSDVSISKRLIRKATELSFANKKFDVFCATGDFSYSIYAEQYCEATRGNITCFAFT